MSNPHGPKGTQDIRGEPVGFWRWLAGKVALGDTWASGVTQIHRERNDMNAPLPRPKPDIKDRMNDPRDW